MEKILFFIPTLSGGGAEKVLVNLVNNLDKKKYSVTVLALFNVGVNKEYLNSDIEYKYIFNNLYRGNTLLLKLFRPSFLFQIMIREEYDVIVSYLQGPTTRIISGSKNNDVVLINWVHNEYHDVKKLSKPYRSIKETFESYAKYDSTVFVAQTVKEAFKKIMPNINANYRVLYNTINSDEIRKNALEKIDDVNFSSDCINLVSVGRFAKQKGFERLLNIVKKLVYENQINIHLYLLGEGELESDYQELIKLYKIQDYVSLLGYKKNPYKYIKRSDIFVCSSYHEGFSTAVTEALILGMPIITTRCSGMQELLGNNEYGIIVDNSENSLYEGLYELLRDSENLSNKMKKMRKIANERGKYFNKDSAVKKVEDHIDILVESNNEKTNFKKERCSY